MKGKRLWFVCCLVTITVQAQNNNYNYFSGSDEDGFSQKVELLLHEDHSFSYTFVDDQVCYENISISFGNWKETNGIIHLNVSDSIKPKVSFKQKPLKKDIITIFFNRANEKAYFKKGIHYYDSGKPEFNGERNILFYDGENNKVDISYNYSGILEILKNKGIKRIEMYMHNTKHKDNYLALDIPENIGQIFINNLSRYVITDFERYSFVVKNNKILMEYPWGTYQLKN